MSYLAEELKANFNQHRLFEDIAALEGEVYREVAGRRTLRVVINEKAYFAKIHYGVGWKEIFKNLLQFRLPVLGAKNEWCAIQKLQALSLQTMTAVAYVSEGHNPAHIHSCILTEALDDTTSLEDLVLNDQLSLNLKTELVIKLAKFSRALHLNGVNHRDYYLCHFLLSNDSIEQDRVNDLHLIDLHRVQIRDGQTPVRWQEKDLAGLLFSAADAGLTRRDLYRFVAEYENCPVREVLKARSSFWSRVVTKAARLYEKDQGRSSNFLSALERR